MTAPHVTAARRHYGDASVDFFTSRMTPEGCTALSHVYVHRLNTGAYAAVEVTFSDGSKVFVKPLDRSEEARLRRIMTAHDAKARRRGWDQMPVRDMEGDMA